MLLDIAYTVRLWRRRPLFASATIVTLALGIGVTTAVYSLVYGVLLRPLPVRDEASLVIAYAATGVRTDAPVSFPRYSAWRDSGAFEALAGVTPAGFDLTEGVAERVPASGVTRDFFSVVGATPQLGRTLDGSDVNGDGVPVVISNALWKRRFAGDPTILGRSIRAGQQVLTVVGVMAPRFERWRGEAHIWVSIERVYPASVLTSRGYRVVTPVGRLRPGGTAETRHRLEVADRALDAADGRHDNHGTTIVALRNDVVPARLGRLVLALFAAAVLTWIITCANVATLLMMRNVEREREVAVRLAVGASRIRILRQMLAETGALACLGGVLGAVLAYWAVRSFVALAPAGLVDLTALRFDRPVVALAGAVTAATVVLCGLLPAIRISTTTFQRAPHQRAAARTRRLSSALIAAQLAGALVVLVDALLVAKSLDRMRGTELGFDSAQILTVGVRLPDARYSRPTSDIDSRYLAAQRDLLERVRSIPGVELTTIGDSIFTPGVAGRVSIAFDDGRRVLNGNPQDVALAPGLHFVGPQFFQLHGVRVIAGREFSDRDDFSGSRVVMVNETLARLHWPNQNVIGKRVNFGTRRKGIYDEPWAEVVGLVADVRHGGIDLPVKPEVYLPILQSARSVFQVVLRTSNPDLAALELRRRLRSFDAEMPVFGLRPLDAAVQDATATVRYSSRLLGLSALVTSILCAYGVFSAFAYVVAGRRREFGIRVALGAQPRSLAGDVLFRAAGVAGLGLAAGLPLALASSNLLAGLLYEVSPRDPVVSVGAAATLVTVALGASCVPARRAATVDPIVVLREE